MEEKTIKIKYWAVENRNFVLKQEKKVKKIDFDELIEKTLIKKSGLEKILEDRIEVTIEIEFK